MVRSSEQEQPSPGGTRHPRADQDAGVGRRAGTARKARGPQDPGVPQEPPAPREPGRQVPHQRQAPLRRASLPWLSPARGARPQGSQSPGAESWAARSQAARSEPAQSEPAHSEPAQPGPAQPRDVTEIRPRRPRPALSRFLRGTAPSPAGPAGDGPGPHEDGQHPRAPAPADTRAAGPAPAAAARPPLAPPDAAALWGSPRATVRPAAGPRRPVGAPPRSAAELRELAEVADLLAELAGLVHDLGPLIVGLMSAASSVGGRPLRTFAMPAELAELTAAHQELRAGHRALSLRFEAALGGEDQATLRTSLAALTERATRAVASAAAVSFPGGEYPGGEYPGGQDAGTQDTGTQDTGSQDAGKQEGGSQAVGGHYPGGPARQSLGTAPGVSPARTAPRGSQAAPSREETDVQTSASGTAPGTPGEQPVRWKAASGSGRRLAPVAVALDAPDIDVAAHWATLVTPYVSTVKIGLELYLRYGPAVVATVRGGSGVQVFLDLKLHDIPNTVAGAARAVAKLRPEILTVHAAGGVEMIKAAVAAAPGTIVAGVTLLTSMGDKDLAELGLDGPVSDAVRRMAALAVGAGARGLVCSPQEVAAVRAEVGPDIMLITPGIRLAGAVSDDQARIATPEEALRAGADLLVVGRPITRAADPGAAAAAIAASLRRVAPVS